MQAVITGDIANFTTLSAEHRQQLTSATERLLKSWVREQGNAEIFRGDSYQVLFDDPLEALTKSIQLICWFKMYKNNHERTALSTRISIGIGTVSYQGKNVLSSDGEAFHLSGRNFDAMQEDEHLSIHTAHPRKNEGIAIILNFVNKYIAKWSEPQTEVIFAVLQNRSQLEIAKALSISQPSVNSRLKAAGWKEIEPAIYYIARLVKEE